MAVIRVQKTDNYTVMSNHHLRNKNLSLKAKGLMSLMLSLPPTWDYSIGGLVAICKESHTSIRSALKELEQNKYLIRYRINNEKGYFSYEYNLYEIPITPHIENQHTDKAQAANAHTEVGHTENSREINKEKENKDKLNTDILDREKQELDRILEEINDSELKDLYKDYIMQRKEKSEQLTPKGLQMLIERGHRLADNDIAVHRAIVETAIINNWLNLYAPRDEEKKGRNGYIEERKRFYAGQ